MFVYRKYITNILSYGDLDNNAYKKRGYVMKKIVLTFSLILLLYSVSCGRELQMNTNQQINVIDQLDIIEEIDIEEQIDSTEEIKSIEDLDSSEAKELEATYAIDENGNLLVTKENQITTLEINALPDSHILEDEQERLLILTDPTDQYQHGILGDAIEASSVTIVDMLNEPIVTSKFFVPEDWVIESLAPIWSDWDLDGEREIVLTVSNSSSGAKLVLYDEVGNTLAESEAIGRGNRWRHALTIASFGKEGQRLLVDVKTPHIGGGVSFYSWDQESKVLKTEASIAQYSTHDIGSREMQMYAVLAEEGNEQVILILPSQSKTELAALRLVENEIHEEWTIPLGGKLTSSLELIEEDGLHSIGAIIDNEQEVIVNFP